MSEKQNRYGSFPEKPHSSRAERPSSFDMADLPMPGGREEDWRFTPMKRVVALLSDELTGQPVKVLCNGNAVSTGKIELGGKSYLELRPVDGDLEPTVGKPGDRAAVVAWNNAKDVLHVVIGENDVLDNPIILDVTTVDDQPTVQHVVVEAKAHSQATVLVEHSGEGKLNQTVEVDLADGAHLTLVSTQEWADSALHASNHRTRVGRNALLKHIVVTLGGDLVRICPDFEFAGPGGEVESLGLYFVDAGQHLEHRPFINHNQPHCISRVTYKGALQGDDAHSVWVGDCLIGANADGTDTYELNRNLLLTDGAKADSVPNLEIENGEIEGAGHASATGRFDDEQLFYLRSRGIPEDEARRLVVRGFFAELIDQIGIEAVQERLMTAIEAELDRSATSA